MSDEDKESKTEAASEKKIGEALEKGNVPFSREAPIFASIAATLIILVFVVRDHGAPFVRQLTLLLEQPRNFALANGQDAEQLLVALAFTMWKLLLPMLVILMAAGLAASIFQNVPRIAGERIRPQWSRISPVSGWDRVFSLQGYIEFGKSVLKFLAIGGVVFMILRADRHEIKNIMFEDPIGLPELLLSLSVRLVSAVSVATIALVAGDLVWTRMKWQRDLRMSKQDLKDEYKQTEGNPAVKAKLRSIALDRVRKQMMASVPRATMILANPTHYAIALLCFCLTLVDQKIIVKQWFIGRSSTIRSYRKPLIHAFGHNVSHNEDDDGNDQEKKWEISGPNKNKRISSYDKDFRNKIRGGKMVESYGDG
ncbi:EscU/YscU/HrcU family type III secretion system export apparatus switch protein [Methylobacterium sp. J-077]|uniref:EscU/YscU/HrcU family type III secretion system export apparatus switch protein n=1 Tax=Methylobacterium sp. J-077 TaxID=2836656 RepID=UPI001FB9819E|nr:EscU/YscU/HrcU family type III secretion system export apparatus switch protein [Methylobacterium sp. J-077]MCJ2122089.1 flagellar type III secretion system protein FlhB [Methylobacterium sp. J-077]